MAVRLPLERSPGRIGKGICKNDAARGSPPSTGFFEKLYHVEPDAPDPA
jgi:hypothetical protein